jgi:ATP-dependent Clp protease protease subunit
MSEQGSKPQASTLPDEVEVELSEILEERAILFLNGPISDNHLNVCASLLDYHYRKDFNDPITLIINSDGGACSIGWSIIDTMNFIRLPVHTTALGTVASMAADIFVNGDHRTIGEHSTLLIHPHSVMRYGSFNQLVANHKMDHIEHTRRVAHYLNNSKYNTKKDVEEQLFTTKGDDLWLTPEEVLNHGLCDKIAKTDKAKRRKVFGYSPQANGTILKRPLSSEASKRRADTKRKSGKRKV